MIAAKCMISGQGGVREGGGRGGGGVHGGDDGVAADDVQLPQRTRPLLCLEGGDRRAVVLAGEREHGPQPAGRRQDLQGPRRGALRQLPGSDLRPAQVAELLGGVRPERCDVEPGQPGRRLEQSLLERPLGVAQAVDAGRTALLDRRQLPRHEAPRLPLRAEGGHLGDEPPRRSVEGEHALAGVDRRRVEARRPGQTDRVARHGQDDAQRRRAGLPQRFEQTLQVRCRHEVRRLHPVRLVVPGHGADDGRCRRPALQPRRPPGRQASRSWDLEHAFSVGPG